ncbi:MAG: aldo/keto reductase [Ruminococcus sp.]|jgi:predicted aldo/keto reductase-like oxidoreductase
MYTKDFRGQKISALGLGGLRFPTDKDNPNHIRREESRKIVDEAIACGINYFDTAYTYQNGDSEKFLGEALAGYPRESFYFATKYYASPGKKIETVFEEQLRRCGMEYFDFYLLHSLDENHIDDYMDPQKDYLGYLLKQKERGRIRYLGFSSHAAPGTLKRFLDWYDGFDMALIQLNYLDWTLLKAKEQYEILTSRNIPVWVMEPLKGGRLCRLNQEAREILKEAASERSMESWGFRFLMGLPNVQTVLSGMASEEQVRDNAGIFARPDPLNRQETEALRKAEAAFVKDLGVPCSGCRYCCDTCPAGLDIPLLMQYYNEKNISGEVWRLEGISRGGNADQCLQCGTCLSHCPQKIDIPAVMKKLRG